MVIVVVVVVVVGRWERLERVRPSMDRAMHQTGPTTAIRICLLSKYLARKLSFWHATISFLVFCDGKSPAKGSATGRPKRAFGAHLP